MNALKCIACKGTHTSIADMRACHMANNVLIGGPNNKEVKTMPKPHQAKQVKTFPSKEEAEAFVATTANARLLDTVKVKKVSVFCEEFCGYRLAVHKTYTVVLD